MPHNKRFRVSATEKGIVAFFKIGRPIPADLAKRPEDLRLPVFNKLSAGGANTYAPKTENRTRVVVGVARNDVWLCCLNRVAESITQLHAEELVALVKDFKKAYTSRIVTGWLVATGKVSPEIAVYAAENGCVITGGAERR